MLTGSAFISPHIMLPISSKGSILVTFIHKTPPPKHSNIFLVLVIFSKLSMGYSVLFGEQWISACSPAMCTTSSAFS